MICLRAFGSVDLQGLDGRSLRAILAQPKRVALLAYLASTRGIFHRRDTLLVVFWPALDTRRARAALNQAVGFLRKELGDSSVLISRGDDELGVDEQQFWFDVAAFRGAIEAGGCAEALDMYRGDFLEGFFVDGETEFQNWLERERARLRGMAARAARELAETREADERFTTAVASARRAVELSDADERAVRALLELLDRLGDRAGAVHAYEEFSRRLADDFDAQPADETKALIAGIRQRARESAVPPSSNASPKDALTHVAIAPRTTTFAPPRDIAGTDLNGWQIVRELGRGGMATVYLAKDVKHDRHVALKVMHSDLALSIGAERFLREIRIMAGLAHPHILPLIDSGAAAGTLYLVAPFVEGESLKERIGRDGCLPVDDALRIAREIAGALDYAHRKGVVHRDIKPANVLLQDDQALVADFGIARALRAAESERVTATGLSPGTPAYMSPEQAAGEIEIDGRSDVYSLGAVLYEMLTGNPPHMGPDAQSVLAKVLTEPVAPARSVRGDVPEHVESALAKALSKNAGDRFESAAAFGDALTAATAPHTSGSRSVRWRRVSHRRVAYALAVPGVALVVWGMLAALGAFGIGPSATLLSRGVLRHGQPVLITSFRVAGLDSSIGDAVESATRTALEESRIVYLVPSDVVSGALERMRLSPQSRLDLVRAREVALREGIRAIIDGHVIRVGERFDVGLRLVSADSGADLVSLRETAESLDDVIPTLDKLIRRLRGSIGESLASVRASSPLPRITTHSMEALRLYAVATTASDWNKARVLLEQAVKADTEFAEGWRRLAATLFNLGVRGPVLDSAEKNAYRYRFNATQIERLRIEARNTGTDRAKGIAILEQVLALGDS